MTIGEFISTIRNNLKLLSEDRIIYDRFIFFTGWSAAKTLMKRDADQTRKIYNTSNIWTIKYLDMIEVSTIEECNLFDIDCTIYRSKDKISKLVETSFGWLYKSITSIDGKTRFFLVNQTDFNNKIQIKYNKDKYVFIYNDYLYTNVEWDILKIEGIFEDLTPCETCKSMYDVYFPLPSYLEDACISMTTQKVIQAIQIPSDNIINKEDDNKLI